MERLVADLRDWARQHGGSVPDVCPEPAELLGGLEFMDEFKNFRHAMPVAAVRGLSIGDRVAAFRRGKCYEGTVVGIHNFLNDDPFDATVMISDGSAVMFLACDHLGYIAHQRGRAFGPSA